MDKDLIRMKCDRIFLERQPSFSKILNQRIQKVYEKYADTLGSQVDYMLLTAFMSEILTSYSGVMCEIMVQIIQEVLSDDDLDNLGELEKLD